MKNAKFYKFLIVILFSLFTITSFGQMTEPDDPGGDPVSEPPLGGGAPVGGATILLVGLGMAYGAGKYYGFKMLNKY